MCEEFEVISHGNMDYNIFLNNLLYRTPHVHKEFEVCLLLDGSVQLLSPSSSRAFSAGSLWVINPFGPSAPTSTATTRKSCFSPIWPVNWG